MNMMPHWARWVFVVLWAALIYCVSSIPELRVGAPGMWEFFIRKGAHLAEYGILFWLVYHALEAALPGSTFVRSCAAAIGALVYAATDEYHQSFVTGRTGTPYDLFFDGSGIALAWIVNHYFSGRKNNPS